MENKKSEVTFEKVLDTEIDDIWDILFPYTADKEEKIGLLNQNENSKPRRYMKFLTM